MDTIMLKCRYCDGTDVIRNGHTRNAKQRYQCKSCGRSSRINPETNGGYDPAQRERVLEAYYQRPSLRRIERDFGISRVTLIKWRKSDPREQRVVRSGEGHPRVGLPSQC